MKAAVIIGGGLAGCTTARVLAERGYKVTIHEASQNPGGLIRAKTSKGGVIYEPHGSHIFHTDFEDVWKFVNRFAEWRPYEHSVLTFAEGRYLTWPLQMEEIMELPWGQKFMEHLMADHEELDPDQVDFESYCINLMGEDAYDAFVKSYTEKQWGRPASELSASFAPKRVQVRTDGDRRLFKDKFQGFPDGEKGHHYGTMIDNMLRHNKITVIRNSNISLGNMYPVGPANLIVVTVPLDVFACNTHRALEWRGLDFVHSERDFDEVGHLQDAMVYNYPSKVVPWIRTHETKVASGQIIRGTVIVTEFPGGSGRYYPVPTKDKINERTNEAYQHEIRLHLHALGYESCVFLGRLASYRYMDMDDVIKQVFDRFNYTIESN